jgi:hypothetical protein
MRRSVSAPNLGAGGRLHACEACGVPVESRIEALRSKYSGILEPSHEELHFTVHALRQRFLRGYFQAKPLRYAPYPSPASKLHERSGGLMFKPGGFMLLYIGVY